jgi:FkbM family methyltransferase
MSNSAGNGHGYSFNVRVERSLATVARALPPLRGKGALARSLMTRAERRGELRGSWSFAMKDGSRVELPRASRMTWAAAFNGLYDPGAVSYVERFVEPGTIVLDVGASLGLWTVPLGRCAAARGARVWAFEPNPANISWIERNVRANDLGEVVTIRDVGLGDRRETVALVSAEYGVGNGSIALAEGEASDKHTRAAVRIERLDEIELPARVSFVKIDTEGYEAAFLRGAGDVLARDRPVIFGEFEPHWLTRRGEDLRAQLLDMGYEVAALQATRASSWGSIHTVSPLPVDLAGEQPLPGNLLLTPRAAPA